MRWKGEVMTEEFVGSIHEVNKHQRSIPQLADRIAGELIASAAQV
jgi:hypothetical protein